MCELYTLIKNEDDKECYIQFQVIDDEELKWVGDNGEPTEVLQQSGWSFQNDEYNKLFSEFIEEADQNLYYAKEHGRNQAVTKDI